MNQKTVSKSKILITVGVIVSLVVLFAVALGLILSNRRPEITIEHDDFHYEVGHDVPVLEVNQKVDYSGIIITETINGKTEQIKITEDMIVSCDDTSTPGKKHIVIKHKHEEFTIEFYVMYRVKFTVDGEIISSQLIDDMSKLVIPDDPYKYGHEFTGWSPEIPEMITNNVSFEATFRNQPKEIPLLSNFEATYGDTLDKFTLPSNEYGSWVFVDELSTSVGDVGENTFQVKFIPTNAEFKEILGEIKINVSKKKLEFKNLETSFEYDGKEHMPLYELDVEGLNVIYLGEKPVDVGTYTFMFRINEKNYEGSISGTFEIVKPSNITIKVNDIEIEYGADLPEITYTVIGIANPELLEIEVVEPKFNNIGTYPLTVKVLNSNYDVRIIPGTLTVKSINLYTEEEIKNMSKSIELDLEIIDSSTNKKRPIVYLEKLGDIKIKNDNPNGYYTWKNPEVIFEEVKEYTLTIIFTPYSNNYNAQELEYTIKVEKKTLNINVLENSYTYSGKEYTIKYVIEDGTYQSLKVAGNIVQINAGTYYTTLTIEDENYQGSISTKLEIMRAIPETNFDQTFKVYWNSKLSEIILPENYYLATEDKVLDVVGDGQKFDVIFDNKDPNYRIINGQFTVDVIKQTSSVVGKNEYNFTYDGKDVLTRLEGINKSHDESNIEFYLGENKITELVDAGDYTLTIKLPGTDHYEESSIIVKVNIAQFVVDEPTSYTATYTDLLSSLILPTSEFGTWTWDYDDLEKTVGDGGTNYFKAKFTPINNNYKELNVEIKVVVAKKDVTVIVTNTNFVYDGKVKYLEYKVLDGELDITKEVNILGNNGRTNAGSAVYNLVVDSKNYQGNATATLNIAKADPVVNWPTISDVNCFTTLSDVVLPEGFTWVSSSTFNPYNEKLTKIGEVTYQASYNKHDNNYNIIYRRQKC